MCASLHFAGATGIGKKWLFVCKSVPELVQHSGAVLARRGVDATLGQAQAIDGTVTRNVGLNDLGDVGKLYVSVPDALGIDHDGRTVLALIEASGFISADGGLQPAKGELSLKRPLEIGGAGGIAAAARVAARALVAAYEDVFCELCHANRVVTIKTGRTQRPADDLNFRLKCRLDLESPGFEEWLRDVLRVLILARPLA